MAKFRVEVEIAWIVEVEASDAYDAEDQAIDLVEGNFRWAVAPYSVYADAREND